MSQTVGRNEPCPCGSGKKYKQCCLFKQAQELANAPIEAENPTESPMMGGDIATPEERKRFETLSMNTIVIITLAMGLFALILGMVISAKVGWVIFGLGLLGLVLWLALRKPPPPRQDNSNNPAALNFGK